MIVEALAKKLKRQDEKVLQDVQDRARAVKSEQEWFEYCIKTAEDFAVSESELSVRAKMMPSILSRYRNRSTRTPLAT